MLGQKIFGSAPAALVAFVVVVAVTVMVGPTQTAAAEVTFVNRTTADGLGNNWTDAVFVDGSTVYVATVGGGLGISTDGGQTFTSRTTANGLPSNFMNGVFVDGSTVYVPGAGLSISTDGGASFTNRTTANGLGSSDVREVFADGSMVYAATAGGLSISTDGGASFTNRTTANGLGSNILNGVFVDGSTVYVATDDAGVSISTDGGASFTNYNTANGLASNKVFSVFADGSTVYAGTLSGLGISTDGGATFVNRTTTVGLGCCGVRDVVAIGSFVYAATGNGLSISTDGGATFTNYLDASGLGSASIYGLFVSDWTVYAATFGGLSIGLGPIPPPTVPDPPTGVSGVAGNGEVTVSWTAPADDGGSAVTGYTVTASPGGQTCTTTGATSCVVSGLTNGTAYTFTVVATNEAGNSSSSEASAPVTPSNSAPTPKSLRLVADFGVGDTVRNGNAALTASRQGVAPFPELVLVLRSVPQVGAGTVIGASTDASVSGALPANLAAGVYSVTAETLDAEGNVVTSTVWFTVNLTGTVTALSSEGPTPPSTTPVTPRYTG